MKRVAIPLIIHRHKVHHHHVHSAQVQTQHSHLECGKHPPSRLRHNHFGALFMELVPQLFSLQINGGRRQRLVEGQLLLFDGFVLVFCLRVGIAGTTATITTTANVVVVITTTVITTRVAICGAATVVVVVVVGQRRVIVVEVGESHGTFQIFGGLHLVDAFQRFVLGQAILVGVLQTSC
jgi:hypothetical protein